jgi:hypothetical protein
MTDTPGYPDPDRGEEPEVVVIETEVEAIIVDLPDETDATESDVGHDVVASSDPDTPEVAATVVETSDDPVMGTPGSSHDVVASSDPDTPGVAATVVETDPEIDDPRR